MIVLHLALHWDHSRYALADRRTGIGLTGDDRRSRCLSSPRRQRSRPVTLRPVSRRVCLFVVGGVSKIDAQPHN